MTVIPASQAVRHHPQCGWLDERGRLKGGRSGRAFVALWPSARRLDKKLPPPDICAWLFASRGHKGGKTESVG